jgi:serine protease Do
MVIKDGVVKEEQVIETPTIQKSPATEKVSSGKAEGDQTDKRFIQNARNSTVTVQTPWGTGSGFFVSENSIVTNKHVVEFNKENFEEFRRKVEQSRKIIDLRLRRSTT